MDGEQGTMIGIRSKWNKMAADKDLKDVRSTILNPFCHSWSIVCCTVARSGAGFSGDCDENFWSGIYYTTFFIRLPRCGVTVQVNSYKLVHSLRKYATVLHVIDLRIFTLFVL